MKTARLLAPMLAASMAFAVPQMAQAQSEFPLVGGDYVDVGGIEIDDGHFLDYADFLINTWRKGQDFAVAQGWITSYEILVNQYPRKGEPDVYLLTRWNKLPTAAEEDKRDAAYAKHMAMTMTEMQKASGERATYRHQAGSMLLREYTFRK